MRESEVVGFPFLDYAHDGRGTCFDEIPRANLPIILGLAVAIVGT